jgi:hypothetical protein
MSDDDAKCQWCGGDGYFEWELNDGKCKTCIVEDCRHEETYREYDNDDSHSARFQEWCVSCGVWRRITAIWATATIETGPWMHDEVRMEDIS